MKRHKVGKPKKKKSRRRKPSCVECGSDKVLPIAYEMPSKEIIRAVESHQIVLADRDDWEGLPQWHCENCACEWRGEWRRFRMRARESRNA